MPNAVDPEHEPDLDLDRAARPLSMSSPRPLTFKLKRDRPFEPRIAPSPCFQRCCAKLPASEDDEPISTAFGSENDVEPAFFAPFPPTEDEDFDLGPPPPAPPVLCRQNAMDATATMQAKLAMARRTEAHLSVGSSMATSRVRGFVVAPIMAHESLALPILPN